MAEYRPTAHAHPIQILVVDDDESIRETLRMVLEGEGYSVICASDGQEALDLILVKGIKIDLILLDLYMPQKDGWQFAHYLRKHGSEEQKMIPIVITSAKSDVNEAETLSNFSGLLHKPFKLEKLIDTCKQFNSLH